MCGVWKKMRQFYLVFPIAGTLRPQLSWTHYRTLMRVEDEHAREWYAKEAEAQNWSSRALDRQVSRLYYERLLSSKDRKAVRAEAEEKIAELSPRDFVRDPVLLEFLGLPETARLLESDMEQRLSGDKVIDARRLVVAPVFIDLHSHAVDTRELLGWLTALGNKAIPSIGPVATKMLPRSPRCYGPRFRVAS